MSGITLTIVPLVRCSRLLRNNDDRRSKPWSSLQIGGISFSWPRVRLEPPLLPAGMLGVAIIRSLWDNRQSGLLHHTQDPNFAIVCRKRRWDKPRGQ